MLKSALRYFAPAALIAFTVGSAHADSFMTSVGSNTKSKAAATVGPQPYGMPGPGVSAAGTNKQIVKRAMRVIKQGNLASSMDTVRVVDGIAMDKPSLAHDFSAALSEHAATSKDPKAKFIYGYNRRMATRLGPTEKSNDFGDKIVTGLAKGALKKDSAAQVGAYQIQASRGEYPGAKASLVRAESLENKAKVKRPLVQEQIKSAKDYNQYTPELK